MTAGIQRPTALARYRSTPLPLELENNGTDSVASRRGWYRKQLPTVEVELSRTVPLGLVKMTATAPDVDPFRLSVYKVTRHFETARAMAQTTIRSLTPTGHVPVIQ